jgi:hypothetical protein
LLVDTVESALTRAFCEPDSIIRVYGT